MIKIEKNNKELQYPKTMFFNCVGSYIGSIFEYFEDIRYLIPLIKYKLMIDTDITLEKNMMDNPWKYQVVFFNNEHDRFNIDQRYFDDIKLYFDTDIMKIKYKINNIFDFVSKQEKNSYIIIGIDEFYIKKSKFYKKIHNKHFLLLKGINYEQLNICVIDTERPPFYDINIQELVSAFHNSTFRKKECYIVKYGGFCYNIEYDELMKKYYNNMFIYSFSKSFFKRFVCDVKEKSFNLNYINEAYRFCILFKIIPFVKLRSIVLMNSSYLRKYNKISVCEECLRLWEQMAYLLLKRKIIASYDVRDMDGIYNIMKKILNVEKELEIEIINLLR